MKKLLLLMALGLASASAQAQVNPVTAYTSASSPTSVLQMVAGTGAYTAGNLIASSGTAGSVVVPSFTMTNTTGVISRLRLVSNDTTSTAWGAQTIQVDLWSAAPTFTNGDRAAWLTATGAASHIAAYTCVMSAVQGDGVFSECVIKTGNYATINQAASTVYWTLNAVTGSGVTGVSKKFTLTVELGN